MTTTFQSKIFTLAEFLAWPETKLASEFIAGSIEQKPMPQGQHSRLQLKLCNLVNTSLGWLIYPDDRIILAFPANQSPIELSGNDRLPVLSELDLTITVDDIFGLLRSQTANTVRM